MFRSYIKNQKDPSRYLQRSAPKRLGFFLNLEAIKPECLKYKQVFRAHTTMSWKIKGLGIGIFGLRTCPCIVESWLIAQYPSTWAGPDGDSIPPHFHTSSSCVCWCYSEQSLPHYYRVYQSFTLYSDSLILSSVSNHTSTLTQSAPTAPNQQSFPWHLVYTRAPHCVGSPSSWCISHTFISRF